MTACAPLAHDYSGGQCCAGTRPVLVPLLSSSLDVAETPSGVVDRRDGRKNFPYYARFKCEVCVPVAEPLPNFVLGLWDVLGPVSEHAHCFLFTLVTVSQASK